MGYFEKNILLMGIHTVIYLGEFFVEIILMRGYGACNKLGNVTVEMGSDFG